jgi:hypothetical protein
MPPLPKVGRMSRKRSPGARLIEADAPGLEPPRLPGALFPGRRPLPLTRQWWRLIWASPLSPHWAEADLGALYTLAALKDRFFREPSVSLAAEARLIEERFGLSPVSRRRLDWTISRPAPPAEQGYTFEQSEDPDSRAVLRALQ